MVANQKRETAGSDNAATCILGTRSRETIYNNYSYHVIVAANQINRAMAGSDDTTGNHNCVLGQCYSMRIGPNIFHYTFVPMNF